MVAVSVAVAMVLLSTAEHLQLPEVQQSDHRCRQRVKKMP